MNTLLLFFAFPVAVIILSAVLQKVLGAPIAVAGAFFAVFLVVTFAFYDESFLIATIAYTILAYISATLTRIIKNIINRLDDDDSCGCNTNNDNNDFSTCNREIIGNYTNGDNVRFIRKDRCR